MANNGKHSARRSDTVGLIGLGLMGSALAERLVADGFRVIGYDLDATRCRALEAAGGATAADSGCVMAHCDRILLSLPDSGIVERALALVADRLRPGHLLIDTTTGDPARAAALGLSLAGRDVSYLDATVSGSSAQVRAGDVIVMAGGEAAAFERCRDLFSPFARRAFHVGPCGSGSTMKLVTNLVLGLNRAALAEGLSSAKALGLDPSKALAVLRESAAYSRIMDGKGEKMVRGEFSPQAKLSQHLKDVRLMLAAGAAAGARMPLSETHRDLLEEAEAAGLGHLDNSAIIQIFDAIAERPEEV